MVNIVGWIFLLGGSIIPLFIKEDKEIKLLVRIILSSIALGIFIADGIRNLFS